VFASSLSDSRCRASSYQSKAIRNKTALFWGCFALRATRKHVAARSRNSGLITLLIPPIQTGNAAPVHMFPKDQRNGHLSLNVICPEGDIRPKPMLSVENRDVRRTAIASIARALRDMWNPERSDPVPDRIAQLVKQLDRQQAHHRQKTTTD